MKRFGMLCVLTVGLVGLSGLVGAEPEKDSKQAEATRTKKLKQKITLDFKQEQLAEVLADISNQVKDIKDGGVKLGAIRFKYDTGVSRNQRVDAKLKGKTVEEALDEILKGPGLGYIVISGKPNDQDDGAIKITKGNERGYAVGAEPKK